MASWEVSKPEVALPSTSRGKDGVSMKKLSLPNDAKQQGTGSTQVTKLRTSPAGGARVSVAAGSIDRSIVTESLQMDRQISQDGGDYLENSSKVVHNHYGPGTPLNKGLPGFDGITVKLKDTYSRMWMNPLPHEDDQPLDNFYVPLKYEYWDLTGRKCEKKNLNLSDVLRDLSGKKRYFLFMGGSGSGKTILLTKLAHDWAAGGHPTLESYDLVLFYKLRNLPKGTSLKEELKAEYLRLFEGELDSEQRDQRLETFRAKKSLVLLDGYDELDDDGKVSLKDVLHHSSLFIRSTFVVTTREETNLGFLKNFQQQIRFSQLDKETTEQIVDQYFSIWSDKPRAWALKQIAKDYEFTNFCQQSPLLLCLLCFVFEKASRTTHNLSMSNIVIEMVQKLTIRQLEKKSSIVSEDDIEEVLVSLGKLFWNAIERECFVFHEDELKSWFGKKFELIMSLKVFQNTGIKNRYEPLHKTSVDHLACHYLNWKMGKMVCTLSKREELKRVLGDWKHGSSLQGKDLHLLFIGIGGMKYAIKTGVSITDGLLRLLTDELML